ncbi:MAG: prolipoprotein diacylglyceryl transferase [Candidatus Bipolaricaulota bacterium]|nr:prolipoprotein diacylglyceryl transferase [Candidatus Bipolaricaulota bacterium]
MHPVLVKIGPIVIRYYGLMYVIAITLGAALLAREARRKALPLSSEGVLDLLLVTIPAAIIGARLYYVLFQWGYYGRHPLDILKVWQGGLAIHGGVIAGALAVLAFSRVKKVTFWPLADAIVPSLVLGQAIGRIGNLMNGDAYGLPTRLPWGIHFPPDSPVGRAYPGLATHPSMIYEMILDVLVFAYLWGIRKKGYRDGFPTAMYVILYSLARSLVSFSRGDDLFLGPIRAPHAISAVLVIGFTAFILWRRLYERTTPETVRLGRSDGRGGRRGSPPESPR